MSTTFPLYTFQQQTQSMQQDMSQVRQNTLTRFFRDEYDSMVGYVKTRVSDIAEQDAEDIVQDIVFNLVNRADVSAPVENLLAYAYQAVRNRIVDFFRTKKVHASLDKPVNEDEDMTLLDIIGDFRYLPDQPYAQTQIAAALTKAMDTLNDEEKAVVIAAELEGYTFNELSDQWDVPINTLLSRKARAMKKIMKQYTPEKPV